MKLLAVDTTEAGCSAALWLDGEVLPRFELAPRQHSELLLPMVEELLANAGLNLGQLDGLAVTVGPGAFTGLRIGAGVVQGLSLAADLAVFPVSSLQAIAQAAYRQEGATAVLAAMDARMQEVYWGSYRLDESHLMQPVSGDAVSSPSGVYISEGKDWSGAGSGWSAYKDALQAVLPMPLSNIYPDILCQAEDVVTLAAKQWSPALTVDAEGVQPVYLRNEVAKKSVKRPSI